MVSYLGFFEAENKKGVGRVGRAQGCHIVPPGVTRRDQSAPEEENEREVDW